MFDYGTSASTKFFRQMFWQAHKGKLNTESHRVLLDQYRKQMRPPEIRLAEAYGAELRGNRKEAVRYAREVAFTKSPLRHAAKILLMELGERVSPLRADLTDEAGRFNYGSAAENARMVRAAHEAGERDPADMWEAIGDAYPPEFWEVFCEVKRGESTDFEPLIAFLEANPYFFRSGYVKESILDLLRKRANDLDPREIERLEATIIRAFEKPNREFRYYLRLAKKLRSERLLSAIRTLADSPQARTRSAVESALSYLEK